MPLERLRSEVYAMAASVGEADPFLLRMIKHSANQAQDSAGLTQHVRATLSDWTASDERLFACEVHMSLHHFTSRPRARLGLDSQRRPAALMEATSHFSVYNVHG